MSADRFPQRLARTRRFTLGQPRDIRVSPDGGRVAFLRSPAGDDPANGLWVLDARTGEERCVADPRELSADGDLPPEEQARRERRREQASGVVAYATDRAVSVAAFALAGRLYVADLAAGRAWRHPLDDVVVDPRPDPSGERIALVSRGGLAVVPVDGGEPQVLAADDADTVTWGIADFIAAEEMGRGRGFWWSPDGRRVAATRVDDAAVTRWHIADPADPARPAAAMAYPAAGTENTVTQLFVLGLDGGRVRVEWDAGVFPYLADVVWDEPGPLTLVVQSRDQRRVAVLVADPGTGSTRLVQEATDPDWVEIVAGVPRWLPDGRLVSTVDDADTRRLAVDGAALTPVGLQVRAVVGVDTDTVTFLASDEPTAVAVWRVGVGSGAASGAGTAPERISPAEGVHDARCGGGTVVLTARTLEEPGTRTTVVAAEGSRAIGSYAERPSLRLRVELAHLGDRALRAAVLLPSAWREADGPLPVLLDPYGGPHAQRVLQHHDGFLTPQWFAEAGFAVLVVDGRGSPGRGPRWEREVAGDLASAPLEDQVDALHAAALRFPLDLTRVAIRGWSFGGYLAALAVLRRPDVFSAAVAGAPVTDWSLYDTHYTERYLGTPRDRPEAYERSSLLRDASQLTRPLLLIHGLADDNVVAAHTLRLSRALLEAGRPHRVLPLSGITHMAAQATVAENLLLLQLDFLREALSLS